MKRVNPREKRAKVADPAVVWDPRHEHAGLDSFLEFAGCKGIRGPGLERMKTRGRESAHHIFHKTYLDTKVPPPPPRRASPILFWYSSAASICHPCHQRADRRVPSPPTPIHPSRFSGSDQAADDPRVARAHPPPDQLPEQGPPGLPLRRRLVLDPN